MGHQVSAAQLSAIWKSLQSPLRAKHSRRAADLYAKAAQHGWISISDIEDVFYLTDVRIDDIRHEMGAEEWCIVFDLQTSTVFSRPRPRQATVCGTRSLASADTAQLLIQLERLGYSVDPQPLVTALIGLIKNKELLTNSELSVLWYEKQRHKGAPLSLALDGEWPRISGTKKLTTQTGYKIAAWLDENGDPVRLEAAAPKFRRRPEPKKEVCGICGVEWYRGDPDSSTAHRKEHKKRLAYLDPKPLPKFLAERDRSPPDASLVTTASPRWKHKEIYRRALAFKREFHYDFVQWGSPTGDDDPTVHGFLLSNDAGIIVGGCAFRRREHEGQSWWGLQWIWIASKYRRSGILASYWPGFRERFGDFHVEGPVSDAMQEFLCKIGDAQLI